MNIDNLALVRATNVIPFGGVVHPISEVPYVKKDQSSVFAFAIRKLLKSKGKLKEINWNNPDSISQTNKENNDLADEYLPYGSEYNSMVLWSINGLVPDDMNNTFSNKTCAIIDGLAGQIDDSEVISLMPTDTAIKGNVRLSSRASVLISKERYASLTDEEKGKLGGLTVKIFDGDVQQAIEQELQDSGRYTSEKLSLNREDEGYLDSDTSSEVKETIAEVAENRKIAQVLHYNVITGQNDEKDKLVSVEDEYENMNKINQFYQREFFRYMFSKLDIDKRVEADASYMPDSEVYMEQLCEEIDRLGIDKYKEMVAEYNDSIENLVKSGKMPTPQQVIDSIKSKQPIDLVALIEEQSKEKQEEIPLLNELKEKVNDEIVDDGTIHSSKLPNDIEIE